MLIGREIFEKTGLSLSHARSLIAFANSAPTIAGTASIAASRTASASVRMIRLSPDCIPTPTRTTPTLVPGDEP